MYDLEKKINEAVFPGLQGGPHDNVIAGLNHYSNCQQQFYFFLLQDFGFYYYIFCIVQAVWDGLLYGGI